MKRTIFFILFLNFLYSNEALNYLNSIRAKSGLAKVRYDKYLSIAAKKHAIYLVANNEYGHYEHQYNVNFFGVAPWDRILKAGFPIKAVIENISFFEPNYKKSIDKLFATVYHRLAFLDTRIDSIGFTNYKKRYVYDMSTRKISKLCKKSYNVNSNYIYGICKNRHQIPQYLYDRLLYNIQKKSKKVILFPYPNATNIGRKIALETPSFVNSARYGFAISASFNQAYATHIKLQKFILTLNSKRVPTKLISYRNDIHKKLTKRDFILLPLNHLKPNSKYSVYLQAIVDGKKFIKRWSFKTR